MAVVSIENYKPRPRCRGIGRGRGKFSQDGQPHATTSPSKAELYWIAGFIEGEGNFAGSTRGVTQVSAGQVNPDPLIMLKFLLGGTISHRDSKNPNHSSHFVWSTSGARARGIAMTLYKLMSAKRKAQIRKMLGA